IDYGASARQTQTSWVALLAGTVVPIQRWVAYQRTRSWRVYTLRCWLTKIGCNSSINRSYWTLISSIVSRIHQNQIICISNTQILGR
ncbi:MAG: hypothetical protein ACK53E_24340, partial [Pseudanabaena sp.]